jgi:hypothetical protein
MPHITNNTLSIVATNAEIGNLSFLFVARTAMFARKFNEKRTKVTMI